MPTHPFDPSALSIKITWTTIHPCHLISFLIDPLEIPSERPKSRVARAKKTKLAHLLRSAITRVSKLPAEAAQEKRWRKRRENIMTLFAFAVDKIVKIAQQ